MKKTQYSLFQIVQENYTQVVDFVSKYYTITEPISIHLGTTFKQFQVGYQKYFIASCTSGCSFGLRKQNQIISVALAVDYLIHSEPFKGIPELESVNQIVQLVQKSYIPVNKRKTIDLFVVCTHPQHTGKGLASLLLKEVQKKAKNQGMTQLVAECTNPISQRVFKNSGFQVRDRIKYNEFIYKGYYPFKNIKNAQSISYVTKLI